MNRIAVILVSTILLTQIASYSFEEIPPQIEWEEPLKGDPDWQVSGRNGSNNSTAWEWLSTYSSTYIHSSNQTIDIGWSAGELIWDNNITYNVTVDIYGYNFTTNSTSIVWSDYSEFSPSSNETNGTFYISPSTLTTGSRRETENLFRCRAA